MAEVWITTTILLCAVLLIRGLLRDRLPAGPRYALWGLVLLRLLVPVTLFHSPVSVMNAMPAAQAVIAAPSAPAGGEGAPVLAASGGVEPGEQAREPAAAPTTPGAPVDGIAAPVAGKPFRWDRIGFGLWAAGAAVVGSGFLITNIKFYRRLRRGRRPLDGVPGGPEAQGGAGPQVQRSQGTLRVEGSPVYRAEFLPSPCLAGLIRPGVYLNAAALRDETTFRHVLAHELCHRRHGDNLWALLRGICLTLWWFHPLVWAAALLSKRDCELFCDEAAVRRLGEAERLPYGRTLVSMVAERRPGPGDLLCATTSMTEGKKQIKERVIQVTGKRKTTKAALALAAALCLLAGVCTFTGAVEGSPLSPLPYQVTANPGLRVEELDVNAVSLPDFQWSGNTQAYKREVLIRWMAEYGKQFYALPEGNAWRAADVQVVPNKFKGARYSLMAAGGWDSGIMVAVFGPEKQVIPNDWVTLAVKPASGIDGVRPLFHGGVPRGTGAYADYVLLQYHVSLEKVDGQWVNRDGICVTPAWNTVPPPDRAAWTDEQITAWKENLSIAVSPSVEGDGPEDWKAAGTEWADHFTSQFMRFYNTGHPGMSDDVRVLSMELQSWEPADTPQSLSFHLKFAFRPIWGAENGAAFIESYCEGPGGICVDEGELAGYVVVDAAVTLTRDNTRNIEGKVVWKGTDIRTVDGGVDGP